MNTYNNTLGETDELTDHLNDQDISHKRLKKEINVIFMDFLQNAQSSGHSPGFNPFF